MRGSFLVISILVFHAASAFAHRGDPGVRVVEDSLEKKFAHIDRAHQVPNWPLKRALIYFQKYRNVFKNQRYLAVVDFTRSSLQRRLFLVDLKSGAVESFAVAHGKGSDPFHVNWAKRFSNLFGSNATSLGFYRTAETYSGDHGLSLRLDGLSNTNSNARARSIVLHSAWYVTPGQAFGRSNGCFAVENKARDRIVDRLRGGALLYAYGGQSAGLSPFDVALN